MIEPETSQEALNELVEQARAELPNPRDCDAVRQSPEIPDHAFNRLVGAANRVTKLTDVPDANDRLAKSRPYPDVDVVDPDAPLGCGSDVASSDGQHTITVRDLSDTHYKVTALAHEYGHVLLQHSPRPLGKGQIEAEAEAVKYLFMTAYEIECPEAAPYIAQWCVNMGGPDSERGERVLTTLSDNEYVVKAARRLIHAF